MAIKEVIVRNLPTADQYRYWRGFEKPHPHIYPVFYKDTYNAMWQESELITRTEALTLVATYEAEQLELLSNVACTNS